MKKLLLIVISAAMGLSLSGQSKKVSNEEVLKNVKRATEFMIDKVSYNGGFVWQYLPDLSRQWGGDGSTSYNGMDSR